MMSEPNPDPQANRQRWYGMLRHIAERKGYRRGWIAHTFSLAHGEYPTPEDEYPPIEPDKYINKFVARQLWIYKQQFAPQKRTNWYLQAMNEAEARNEPLAHKTERRPAYTKRQLKGGATLITLAQPKPQEPSAAKRS